LVNAERETILTSLKSARRDAQKADSALRAEIDTLRRTFEKNSATELRGKQKVLALQEAVKRAQNTTKETEDLAREVEVEIPGLKSTMGEKERQHRRIKTQADKVRKEREELEEKERKRIDAMNTELAGLKNKLERLGIKKEKMESTLIPDLEEKLQGIEKEIEAEEEQLANFELDERARLQLEETYVPLQRIRHNSAGPIGRPNPAPIQRPTVDWSPTQPHRAHPTHSPRSQSYHIHGTPFQAPSSPIILTNPQRRLSLKATTHSASTLPPLTTSNPNSNSASSSSPTPSSPTRSTPATVGATSTLSSRAPAFEPSRPLGALKINNGGTGYSHSGTGFSTTPIPIPISTHRPTASASSTAPVGAGRPGRNGPQGQHGIGHGFG